MKNEHVILKSASSRVTLSVAKGLAFLFALMLSLTACSDYEADYENMYGYLVEAGTDVALSSSSSSSRNLEVTIGSSSSSIKYGSLTDSRDGQTYKTVTIGTQTWMAENLNYNYNEGSAKSYCYNNSLANCNKYGRLYTWPAAMDSAGVVDPNGVGKGCGYYSKNCSVPEHAEVRGVCPSGWHLPSDSEWKVLINNVGGISTAGLKLKSANGWNSWQGGDGNGTDSFGFTVLPAGARYDGEFHHEGYDAFFWSSTEDLRGFYSVYDWKFFNYDDEAGHINSSGMGCSHSVRCLKDSSPTSGVDSSSNSSSTVIPDPDRGSSSSNIQYGSLTDSRDNQTYKTVTIGTQTWMAENLNYDPGNVSGMGSYAWQGCYNNSAVNCITYGRLYTWEVAMNNVACGYGYACNPSGTVQGVCPEGWHLPSRDEWNTLFTAVGGSSTAGTKLKSISGWNSNSNGTDSFGFSALPAGYRDYNGNFDNIGNYAYFWSSAESSSGGAHLMCLYYYYEYASLSNDAKNYARSVRCLKD